MFIKRGKITLPKYTGFFIKDIRRANALILLCVILIFLSSMYIAFLQKYNSVIYIQNASHEH